MVDGDRVASRAPHNQARREVATGALGDCRGGTSPFSNLPVVDQEVHGSRISIQR